MSPAPPSPRFLGPPPRRSFIPRRVGPGGDGLVAEIARVVGTPWQGSGIATEAVRGLVDWLAGRPVRGVIAHIHPAHRASAAVAAAAGLTPTADRHDGEVRWHRHIGR